MSRRAWADYLDAATTHLEASRAAIARGSAIPPSPARPVDRIPDELCHRAQVLGMGYDALAAEVIARMSEMKRPRQTPHAGSRSGARFVDRYA